MDLFVEKEFLEEFELDYDCSEYKSDVQKIVYSIFTEYTQVRLFINAPVSFVFESRILSIFSDSNLNIQFDVDFDGQFNNQNIQSNQSLVLTKNTRDWFPDLKRKGILCYSYSDYEFEIQNFIDDTHFKIDLSDQKNIPIKWSIFKFLNKQTNFVIVSDPYILNDSSGQEMRKNIIPLLKENLNKNHFYSLFIITEVDKEIDKKLGQIYSALADYKIKIYVFNRFREIENILLHDRLLYSNYTITDSGKGFNLNFTKVENSQISSASLFEKYTYQRFINHLKELNMYVSKLEQFNRVDNPYKTNKKEAFAAFREITACS